MRKGFVLLGLLAMVLWAGIALAQTVETSEPIFISEKIFPDRGFVESTDVEDLESESLDSLPVGASSYIYSLNFNRSYAGAYLNIGHAGYYEVTLAARNSNGVLVRSGSTGVYYLAVGTYFSSFTFIPVLGHKCFTVKITLKDYNAGWKYWNTRDKCL